MGSYIAIVLVLLYMGFLVHITYIYVKTRFENLEDSHKMKTIVWSSVVFSIVIILVLVFSALSQIKQIRRLKKLNQAQECFKDDKFMQLN